MMPGWRIVIEWYSLKAKNSELDRSPLDHEDGVDTC